MTEFLFFNTQSTKVNRFDSIDQSFLDRLYKTIEDKLGDEKFGVAELAQEIGVSKSQLHRRLHSLSKQSASQIIREHRLKKAMEMLENEVGTVAEISYLVGFGSPSYFITCFHDYYGYPPGEVKIRKSINGKRKSFLSKKNILISIGILAVLALTYFALNLTESTSEKIPKHLKLENSIAVMALEDHSPEGDMEFRGVGIAMEIARLLTKFENLKVLPPTSSFQFKDEKVALQEVGRKLGADYILAGIVIVVNDKTRVFTRLIDVRDGTQTWSDKYDYNLTDLFTIQDSVAAAISSKLQLALSGEKATKNITTAAYDLYFKETFQMTETWNRESFEMAIKYFQEAIKLDPEFAAAYSALAAAYIELTGWNSNIPPSEEYIVKCQDAALKALELDPDQAEAYNVLRRIVWRFENDWNKANTYFKKGMELKPTATWAYLEYMNFLTWMGDFDKSISLGKKIIEMDPLSTAAHMEHAFSYYIARLDREFIDQCMKTFAIDPDYYGTKVMLALYYIDKREFEKAADYAGITDSTKITIDTHSWRLLVFGTYYGYSGDTAKVEECLKILHQQRQGMSLYSVESVYIYISLGKYDEALNIMNEGFNLDIRPAYLVQLKTLPHLDPLRDNPRFIRLLDKMKFDEYKNE